MATAAQAIVVQQAAKKALISSITGPAATIASTDYTEDEALKFQRTFVNALKRIPSSVGVHVDTTVTPNVTRDYGSIYLIEDGAAYTARDGAPTYTEATRPGALTFTTGGDAAQIAQERANHALQEDTFNTQEGVRAGLREMLVKNLPPRTIMELADAEDAYENVEPRDIMAVVLANARPMNALNAKELKNLRDEPIEFEGEDNLALQFVQKKKHIAELTRLHQIGSSESELMMEWMLELEKQKDFEDAIEEWRGKAAHNQTFANFVTFFGNKDKEIRRLKKLRTNTTAGGAGYNSAANINELEGVKALEEKNTARVSSQMQENCAELALALQGSIDQVTATTNNDARPAATTAAPIADPTALFHKMMETLTSVQTRLANIENGGGGQVEGGGGGGRGRGGGDVEGGNRNKKNGAKKCDGCGRIHKNVDKCWRKPENAHLRPEWFKKKLEKEKKE